MMFYVSEPILESAFEVFVLLTLWGQHPELISGSQCVKWAIPKPHLAQTYDGKIFLLL